jgi:fatty acid desaturase
MDYFVGTPREFGELKNAYLAIPGEDCKVVLGLVKPNYFKVWISIALGHLGLLGPAIYFLAYDTFSTLPIQFIKLSLVSMVIGFSFYYLSLFFHAASHYNLAISRPLNDMLARIFLAPLFGADISTYRRVHFDHHKYLGAQGDPENAYIQRLDAYFFGSALIGITFLKKSILNLASNADGKKNDKKKKSRMPLVSAALHTVIFFVTLVFSPTLALAWAIGFAIVFPLASDLRLILEHKVSATQGVSTKVFQGATSRLFGGAGFNYHLLHHWDPSLHYTCLASVMNEFRRCGLIDSRWVVTTYSKEFIALFGRK